MYAVFFKHFPKIVKIKIKSVKCNHAYNYLNRIYYLKLQNNVMHTKYRLHETIIWLNLFLPDSLNNLFELSASSMFTITAEYIITFNITHVYQFMPVMGLFLKLSQAYVSLDWSPFH